jgi:hypothetical protein
MGRDKCIVAERILDKVLAAALVNGPKAVKEAVCRQFIKAELMPSASAKWKPRKRMNEPQYVGDGVYAQWECDLVKFTAGVNVIFLEPEVFATLERSSGEATRQTRHKTTFSCGRVALFSTAPRPERQPT